jgi:rhamnosyltransferase subunit B
LTLQLLVSSMRLSLLKTMNILLIPIGSHGDVHPFLGIGLRLRDRGHRVTVATNEYFEALVRNLNLEFISLGAADEFRKGLKNPDLWHPMRGFKTVCEIGILPYLRTTYDVVAEHVAHGDSVVVAHALAMGARVARDALHFPMATIQLSPAVFRSEFENAHLPGIWMPHWLPRWIKRGIYNVGDKFFVDKIIAGPLNAFRAEKGLPPVKSVLKGWWFATDRIIAMFPEWFAARQPDWPVQTRMTDFPLYDERGVETMSPEVREFLEVGDPPIVFTPGSAMTFGHQFFEAAVGACQQLGRRGLLLTRHAAQVPRSLPNDIRHIPYTPFSELLPHAAALVHHGGIGTTAQALAAGVPQLIMPMAHDQFDNADRVKALGVGDFLSRSRFGGKAVGKRLHHLMSDQTVRQKAREIAGRFTQSDGIGQSCELIEELAEKPNEMIGKSGSGRGSGGQ